jgi:hypothetical protein
VKKTLLLSVPLWLVTLVLGVAAVISADFGVSAWVFVLLFAWLLSIGLPTTLAVVTVASFWSGGGLGPFLGVAAGVSVLSQTVGVYGIRKLRGCWRGAKMRRSTG